jgi:hypothetical protein
MPADQRGAGNMGGFVPVTWQKALAPFMDQIPPRDFESVRFKKGLVFFVCCSPSHCPRV